MKKIIILIPVYNDWEFIQKVLDEINSIISQIKLSFQMYNCK